VSNASENMEEKADIRFRIPGIDYDSGEEDLFPKDEEDQRTLIGWARAAFEDSKASRSEIETRWHKYYKMYRSYPGEKKPGDWTSRVWIPLSFYVIETIVPRLVAQLPKLTVEPVGPEDVEGAKQMEFVLEYVTQQTDLYLELVKAFRSALTYGTGILKTAYEENYAVSILPETTPGMMDQPLGQLDVDGNPQQTTVETGQQIPTGKMTRQEILKYAGPAAEAVDIFDFFVSPEAQEVQDASYVVHRVFRTRQHLERLARQGKYHLPEDTDWDSLGSTANGPNPHVERLGNIGQGPGDQSQTAKGTKLVELREFWTDDVVFTIAGEKALIRCEKNPYAHGEKPFVRIVDHMVQQEFWGVGELEPLEGIQDTINSLWNSRIDNVKLVLNKMFAVSVDYLENENDLRIRPGGVIRLREGVPIDQAIKPIDLGEVTDKAYEEASEMERLSEKVTGVSAYQMGTDSPALNRTATGVALISEQGNTRFAHKVRISELTGLRRLARHFGSVLQQFLPEGFYVRLQGPGGQYLFQTIDQQSIAGAFDYNIEAESASQTESLRRDQTLSMFQMLVLMPEINRTKLIEDVLDVFGRKDTQSYLNLMAIMQQQMADQQALAMQQQGALPPGGEEQNASSSPTEGPPGATGGGPPSSGAPA